TTLYDGREWRIHYWLFRKGRIFELANAAPALEDTIPDSDSVYEEIPEDLWETRRPEGPE
ncbi:MAG: hypothetical protein ACE5I4_08700, partial [Thermoplasmata archaeon]